MWIYAKNGFLSIVQHRERPESLIVRGRVKGDIEHYFPGYTVTRTDDADYLYRAIIPKPAAAEWIRRAVTEIDYDRFKPAVTDKRRHDHYLDTFFIMEGLQEQFKDDPR